MPTRPKQNTSVQILGYQTVRHCHLVDVNYRADPHGAPTIGLSGRG
jgi:hypothetical protein